MALINTCLRALSSISKVDSSRLFSLCQQKFEAILCTFILICAGAMAQSIDPNDPLLSQPFDFTDTSQKYTAKAVCLVIVVITAISLVLFILFNSNTGNDDSVDEKGLIVVPPDVRASAVFCSGEILHTIQMAHIFNDSKEFVDMPLKTDPEIVVEAFKALSKPYTKEQLELFVEQHFELAGSDVIDWTPLDFTAEPRMIANIRKENYRQWAHEINELWLLLGRQASEDVFKHPERHTLIATRHPLMVPGGRFRESYYWDTFWIVKGLLACDMHATAKGVVLNLLDFVRRFGFVPNGGRIYYLNRSQPPLLTEMVAAYFNATGDFDFLSESLPVLDLEYQFWMRSGPAGHAVHISDGKGDLCTSNGCYTLNRFIVSTEEPRPESYREDIETAEEAGASTPEEFHHVYSEIAAGAETGWDFSSRWFRDQFNISTIETGRILPVDLNAILFRMETTLESMHEAVHGEESSGASRYRSASADRLHAMEKWMYNPERKQWFDLWLKEDDYKAHQNQQRHLRSTGKRLRGTTRATVDPPSMSDQVALSNFLPLWAGAYDRSDKQRVKAMIASFRSSGLIGPGGVATTLQMSGQQWDWPNAWPPLQHMVVEGLANTGLEEGRELARQLARDWVSSNYKAYSKAKFMYEKYDATVVGEGGGGGEYIPQTGFGWTNGVILDYLARYGSADWM